MKKKKSFATQVCCVCMAVLMVLGNLPASVFLSASAATEITLYAAAYAGAANVDGTTLPATVQVSGENKNVDWQIAPDTFNVIYDTVTVNGTTTDGTAVKGIVEIIPQKEYPLTYFVDVGRVKDSFGTPTSDSTYSPLYDAVKSLEGSPLVNQKPDQRYVSGTTDWGINDSVAAQQFKNSVNGSNKDADGVLADPSANPSVWGVGVRAAALNNSLVYQLKALNPGSYTLSTGTYDWYGSRNRVMQPTISYTDTSGSTHAITMDSFDTQAAKVNSGEFTIPENIDTEKAITLTYAHVSGEGEILSWFAIANGKIKSSVDKTWKDKAATVNVTLNGNDIKTDNVNGLTFKGFGVLSANSTSSLLMDYKSEQPEAYAQMLQTLFGGKRPVMTNVKIELGNDRNTSTGPDPCTMRTSDEPANVTRSPGFQLAADAKKINPNIKITILRWEAPGWVNNNDDIYKWYKYTILAAYRTYGYMVDYVNPGVNEQGPDISWSKDYANRVKTDTQGFENDTERTLYNKIKVVISDEVGVGSFGNAMMTDDVLRNSVAAAGYHYSTEDDGAGNFKKLADSYDKEIWNSEAQATFSNSAYRPNNNMQDPSTAGTGIGGTGGALEMANTIIKGFVNSRRTNFIYQPAIASFYEGGQYSSKNVVQATDPWSGWIHYDAGVDVLAQFSKFAKIGWENSDNTEGIWRAVAQASSTGAAGTNPVNGRNGTPNYITLASPDKKDFSTVIVNDSEFDKIYKISAANMSFSSVPSLEVWETRASDASAGQAFNSNYLKYLGDISPVNGVYTVSIKPYSIVTVTTLPCKDDSSYQKKLPTEGTRTVLDTDSQGHGHNTADSTLYSDDYEYTGKTVPVIAPDGTVSAGQTESFIASRGGDTGFTPLYTSDRNGAFEGYKTASGNYVLRQQVDTTVVKPGGAWNGGDPVTNIGDMRWTNYKASVDVSFEDSGTYNGANYALLGVREQQADAYAGVGAPYYLKFWQDGGWQLFINGSSAATGNVATGTGGPAIANFNTAGTAWHNLAVQAAGNTITAYIDGTPVTSYTDSAVPELSGRVTLGSGFYHTDFDRLKIETIPGYVPYYTQQLDNLEMYDLSAVPKPQLVYDGNWSHANGQGMFVRDRSVSKNKAAGATLTYTFSGTGFDICGDDDGSAKLDVSVDGKLIAKNASTLDSGTLYQTYALRGLRSGQHTITVKVVSGTLTVDYVSVVPGLAQGSAQVNVSALSEAVGNAKTIQRQDSYDDTKWSLFTTARAMADEALNDPDSYRLDQEGESQLASRLNMAAKQLDIDTSITALNSPGYIATFTGQTPTLPATVTATRSDGTTGSAAVKWDLSGIHFDTPYQVVSVTGSYGTLTTTCKVEVVPEDIRYFADLNATSSSPLGYDSPEYLAVKALLASKGGALLNSSPDAPYDAAKGWGYSGFDASGAPKVSAKGIVSGDYSKLTTTGIYTANEIGASLVYTFDNLPKGKHTVSFGSYNGWWTYDRPMDIYLVHDGSSEKVDSIPLSSTVLRAEKSYVFTMAEKGSFSIKLVATGNQSPLLSYVALSGGSDKAALTKLYDDNKDKANNNYTEATWTAFQQALSTANTVLQNADASQGEVDGAYTALQQAVSGLKAATDKTALQKLYNDNKDKANNNYTEGTWNTFQQALNTAKTILQNADAAQDEVDGACTTLQQAVSGLKVVINKTDLQKLYDDNKDKANSNYTEATWNAFQQALNAAKAVLQNADATQAQADDAKAALQQAVSGLKAAVDKTALQKLYDDNKNKANSNYTEATWNAFQQALNAAKAVLQNADSTQGQVDNAKAALDTARKGLTVKEPPQPQAIEIKHEGTGVTVTAPANVLPEGATLHVDVLSQGNGFQLAQNALSDVGSKLKVLDIYIQHVGKVIQPDGTITVRIPIPTGFDKTRLALYYIAADGKRTQLPIQIEGNEVVFHTTHFSTYALVETAASSSSQNGSSQNSSGQQTDGLSPQTGEAPLTIYFVVGAAAAFAVIVLLSRRKKGQKQK